MWVWRKLKAMRFIKMGPGVRIVDSFRETCMYKLLFELYSYAHINIALPLYIPSL